MNSPRPTHPNGMPDPASASAAVHHTSAPINLGLLETISNRVLTREADWRRLRYGNAQFNIAGLRDYEFAGRAEDCKPPQVFDRMRWGGQLIFISHRQKEVDAVLHAYENQPEWIIEQSPLQLTQPRKFFGSMWPKRYHYLVARKVLLDPVAHLTARHSYDVRLTRATQNPEQHTDNQGWVVLKRVPTLEQAISRLRHTCPTLPAQRIEVLATKLVRKVFPLFLTREAAFLKLLQRDMPENLRHRTPKVFDLKADARGLIQSMSLSWLRSDGEPIEHLAFAKQSAEMLRALHDRVGIMHLDLRLDNLVITEHGVGMVDFGSSIRLGEDLNPNPMLLTLSKEMMETSEIRARLKRFEEKQLVNSVIFERCFAPPTPAFDLFALATSITRPHDNPDFKGLVKFDPQSQTNNRLTHLRDQIITPPDPKSPMFKTVHDVCHALGMPGERPRFSESAVRMNPPEAAKR